MRKSQAETNLPKVKTVHDDNNNTELTIGLLEDGRLYISIEEEYQYCGNGDMCCIYLPPKVAHSILLWLIANQIGEK